MTVGRPSGSPTRKLDQIDWRHSLGLRLTLLVMAVVLGSLAFAFFVIDRSVSHGLGTRTDDDLRADVAAMEKSIGTPTTARAALEAACAYVDPLQGQGFRATSRLLFVIGPKDANGKATIVTANPGLHTPSAVNGFGAFTCPADEARAAALAPATGGNAAPASGYGGGAPIYIQPGGTFNPAGGGDGDDGPEAGASNAQITSFLNAGAGFSRQQLGRVPGAVRVYVVDRTYGGQTFKLAVATPIQATSRAQSVVRSGFLLAGGFGILAALLGGTFVATRISRPLRRMAGVATEVDEGELDRRMGNTGRRDEIQVLAGSFDHMLERLQGAFERQRAFTADASHELRTPLTVIRGQLEVLSMQDNPEPDEMRRVERLVRTEVDRMGRLVEDLLLLNRSEGPGFVQRSPIDLPALLRGSVEGFEHTADRRFEVAELPDVVLDVDPGRVTQAVRNLVRNAVEHTQPGGLVRLSAELVTDGRGPDRARIFVDDNGPGIPEDQREQVFERFHRAQVGRGADGGAGLGLAIVRSIADAHGGSIRVDASPEGGARFVLELPLDAPRAAV